MSEFVEWFKSLNQNGRVTYFLGQEGKISEEAWNHQQDKIDNLESKLQSVLNLACKLQYSSGERIYSEIKEMLK